MIYVYKEDNKFIYVKCGVCGKESKIFHPIHVKKDPSLDHGDYYEYQNPIFNCNHDDEFPNRVYKRNPTISDTPPTVSCPHCGSTQIQLVKRGWSASTGLLGSGKVKRYCVNCMKEF
jgi:ribosomal protein S27E